MALIANARMYAVTPQAAAAWRLLFTHLAETSGVDLTYVEHAAPAPLEDLWSRDDLGAVFMCGFPFASAQPKPQLIAAPVPNAPRYGGAPVYCTDFVVRADSPFGRLEDTLGGKIGWTVHHSQSGFNAVRYHLLHYADGPRIERLYREWVGPLVTPRAVIDAVLSGRIDVGPLDSFVHDLLERHDPATVSQLRTVGSTVLTPIPPLVASPSVPPEALRRLRAALVESGTDPALRPVLDTLALNGFSEADPAGYGVLLEQARAAEKAGPTTV